ncbi:helix-turn-helix domain-containing protein [Pediococcus inopinatus]|uniref:helix-turn-helix domain-containing protein n=1 Tax=Pediococcus inopinatus TaxID=114090 RepID=UPI002B25FCEC|nr:helix-turn-helix domain-containing protein [Pediococcus inopinatus]WPC20249.1 helix-turn-helix domain-containing protein [Pediococcus inopinatus]
MTFGDTLKLIRISKSLSQKELNNNLMSRTSISKIENNRQIPTYPKAIILISELGVTPNEFEYIRNGFKQSSKQEIIDDFIHLSNSTQHKALEQLFIRCNNLLSKGQNDDIYRISLIIKALLCTDTKSLKELRIIVTPVWKYLETHDSWDKLDLYLVNNILFLFSSETSYTMANTAIKNIDQNYPQLRKLKNGFLLNEAFLLMQQNCWNSALQLLELSMSLSQQIQRFDLFILGRIRIAICNGDFITAKKERKVLSLMGATNMYKSIEYEINEFRKQIQKKTH